MHATEAERDLVCGQWLELSPGTPTVAFGVARFVFCSEACRRRFAAMPVLYLRREWSRKHADRFPPERFVP